MGFVFEDNDAAIALLRSSLGALSERITSGAYDFTDLDLWLGCEMFVGDINVFRRTNRRPFYFVSSYAAKTMGYEDQEALMDAGGLTILARHYRKLEAIYWVRHLAALPFNDDVRVIDYIAGNRVVQRTGRLGFEDRRYLACNLKGYRSKYDVICIGVGTSNLDAEALSFAAAVSIHADVRARAHAVRELCRGARRTRVFLMRSRKTSPARIAAELGTTVDTVSEHLTAIYRILGLTKDKLAHMVDFADRAGFKQSAYYRQEEPLDNNRLFDS